MGKTQYVLTSSVVTVEDSNSFSYGIACMENAIIKKYFQDISTDKERVKKALRLFNKGKLSPIQFEDAVEDIVDSL